MNTIARALLYWLGYKSFLCRDGNGVQYEAWVKYPNYFHVYHERVGDKVVRWRTQAGPTREDLDANQGS